MSFGCKIGFHKYKILGTYWKETKKNVPAKAYNRKKCCICNHQIDEYQRYQERIETDLFKEMCKSLRPCLPVIH